MISAVDPTEALLQDIGPLDRRVADAMRAVPRHLFIPPVALACPPDEPVRIIDLDADPEDWWHTVYSDTSIVTQLDDGTTDIRTGSGDYTSSCSAPGIVAMFLELLDPEPGTRVLEIGTGVRHEVAHCK